MLRLLTPLRLLDQVGPVKYRSWLYGKPTSGHQAVMLQGRNKPAPAILSGLPAQALHAKHQSKLAATSTDAVSTEAVESRPPAKLVQYFEGDLQPMAALASISW